MIDLCRANRCRGMLFATRSRFTVSTMSIMMKRFKISLLVLILTLSLSVVSFGNELQIIAQQQNSVLFRSRDSVQNEDTKYVHSSDETRTKNELHGKNAPIEIQRRAQDPSDHYFCGIGYADASESCAHPCPSGSTSE